MDHNLKATISKDSKLPIVAAVLSALAAVCMGYYFINLLSKGVYFNVIDIVFYYVIPIFAFLLQTVLLIVIAKKNATMMIIPTAVLSIHLVITVPFALLTSSYRSYIRYNMIGFLFELFFLILAIAILLLCVLTFLNKIKTSIPLISVCAIKILFNIGQMVYFYLQYSGYGMEFLPLNIFAIILYFISVIVLALSIRFNDVKERNKYPVYPMPVYPMPRGPVFPPNMSYQQNTQQNIAQNQHMPSATEAKTDRNAYEKLKQLSELHNSGIITDEEYEVKRKELLDQF